MLALERISIIFAVKESYSMKKVITLIAILCFTAGTVLKAQNNFSSDWLNPQFKPGNILQNFNKPLSTHVPEIRSDNPYSPLTPIYDSTYYWQWNSTTGKWDYSNKVIDIVYSPKNLVSGNLNKEWNGNGWKNESQLSVTYNPDNLVTTEVTQTWSGTNWVNYTQTINTYNPSNLEISSVVQLWSGSDWVNCFQQIPAYNRSNLETSDLKQTWNGSEWVNYSQTNYTYNSFNDLTNYLFQLWNDSTWENSSQTTNTYDTYDNLANSLSQLWNGSTWINCSETSDFAYNSDNEVTGFSAQTWNGDAWLKSGYITNTYDANNIIVSFAVKNFDAKGIITSGDSVTYYFNKTVSATEDEQSDNSTIKLYPNPASNIIHVVITLKQATYLQLRLINIQGQIVWTAEAGNTANYQNNISVANLPGGVYLFELISGNGTESQKVVVTH